MPTPISKPQRVASGSERNRLAIRGIGHRKRKEETPISIAINDDCTADGTNSNRANRAQFGQDLAH
jgi:hypothetical protein